MSPIDALPPLRDVVREHGLDARKALGQNFLFDLNLTSRIARAAGPLTGTLVIEVGPGPGGLTRALLAQGAARVIAIERDERCLAALAGIATHYPSRLDCVRADALEVDIKALIEATGHAGPVRIVANLPYNVGTPLLVRWLQVEPWPPWYDRMILMFQREVAQRIVATPRERSNYGRLGVLCSWRTRARILFDVPASAFTPQPKVTSSVVEFLPRSDPLACDARHLSAVTQAAFGQRRKMLRQSLKALQVPGPPGSQPSVDVFALLDRAGIQPTLRAEDVDVPGFVALAQGLQSLRKA